MLQAIARMHGGSYEICMKKLRSVAKSHSGRDVSMRAAPLHRTGTRGFHWLTGAEFCRGHADHGAEGSREGAVVVEAAFQGDVSDGAVGLAEEA